MSLLEANNVRSGYGELEIIHGVSIELKRGEVVSIIGPNGSGKSTLMKTLMGHLFPTEGEILLDGEDITNLEPHQVVRKGMCYVPQEDNIFPTLSVSENLEMGAFTRKDNSHQSIVEVYDIFPLLEERENQNVEKLSGGEQQMVAMGLALVMTPRVLLLDEPTSGLAPNLAQDILSKVETINESGVSILMVEQNAKEALAMSARGYVLAMGEKKFEDTGPDLLQNAQVRKLYLGC